MTKVNVKQINVPETVGIDTLSKGEFAVITQDSAYAGHIVFVPKPGLIVSISGPGICWSNCPEFQVIKIKTLNIEFKFE
jgi:hypothetical protein